jgi:hypothetical protein
MKTTLLFSLLLTIVSASFAQAPVSIAYNLPSNLDGNQLSPTAIVNAPKECIIDFNYAASSVRVVMESPDGLTNYVDRVFPLEVQAFPDSTYVYGQAGAWTIGLGQFENVNAFRVRLFNPAGIGLGAALAQGTYP